MKKKIVIVSGLHRSGTSWLGKILSIDKSAYYVNEPFNPSNLVNHSSFNAKYYWDFYCNNKKDFFLSLDRVFKKNYKLINLLSKKYSIKKKIKSLILFFFNYLNFFKFPVIKDPFIIFHIEDIIKEYEKYFDLRINLIYRNPINFIASCKKKEWDFDFRNFLNQKCYKFEYNISKRELMELNSSKVSTVHRLTVLWKIINFEILNLVEKNKEINLINHNIYSLNPIKYFKKLYKKNDLFFSKSVEKRINKICFNNITTSSLTQNIHRNSSKVNNLDEKILTDNEINFILVNTQEILKKLDNLYDKRN